MLDSRYLYLHEALGLGPMWLSQTAYLIPSEITETNTPVKNDTRPVARSAPDNSVRSQPVRTSHQTSPADITATQPASRHRDALRQIINQPATQLRIHSGNIGRMHPLQFASGALHPTAGIWCKQCTASGYQL